MTTMEGTQMYCCPGFEHLIGDAGERGLSAIVVKAPDRFRFKLQSRGVSFLDRNKLAHEKERQLGVTVNLECETGLQYCPFCGTRLEDLAKQHVEAFQLLADSHRKYNMGIS